MVDISELSNYADLIEYRGNTTGEKDRTDPIEPHVPVKDLEI